MGLFVACLKCQAIYVEASESMMRHLKLNLEEGSCFGFWIGISKSACISFGKKHLLGDDNDANLTLPLHKDETVEESKCC